MSEKYWDGKNWLKVVKSYDLTRYYLGDKLHRNDGPAVIFYHDNGSIEREIYYFVGEYHRINGPAVIDYFENGNFIEKNYFYYGKLHRDNGPALLYYDEDSSCILEMFYFNGIEFDPDKLPFEMPIDTEEKEFYMNLIYRE